MLETELANIRTLIDQVDKKIQTLINERAGLNLKVAALKREHSQEPVYYRPEREAQILRELIKNNHGPLPDKDIANIFQQILSACRALQEPMKIAYLGPAGSFAHTAAIKHFGTSIIAAPVETPSRLIREIEAKNATYGVLPIENTIEGILNPTVDFLMDSKLHICGEIILPIHQHLLRNSNDSTAVKRIYAEQRAFHQCSHWLAAHYPNAEQMAVSNPTYAAYLAKDEIGAAAIASDMAAETYQLAKVAENIEDQPNNVTRFIIIGKEAPLPSGDDKTSLVISSANVPGALANLIQPFAAHKVNITLIESRPHHQQITNYLFFLDIAGHQHDLPIQQALAELGKQSILIRLLGSYPKGIL